MIWSFSFSVLYLPINSSAPEKASKESRKEGKKEGEGKLKYHNGDVFEGTWRNDKIDGHGKLISAKGDVVEGNWLQNDKLEELPIQLILS